MSMAITSNAYAKRVDDGMMCFSFESDIFLEL